MSPGADVFDRLFGSGQKFLAGRGGPGRAVGEAPRLVSRADVRRRWPGARLKELPDRRVDPAAGLVVAEGRGRRGAIGDMGQDHDVERLGDVVKDEQTVVEGEAEIGKMEVVGGRMGQPLRVPHGVVGGIPHGTAREWRQFCQPGRLVDGHSPFELCKRISRLEFLHRGRSRLLDPHPRAEGFEPQEGLGPQKAVAADLLPPITLSNRQADSPASMRAKADSGVRPSANSRR